VALLSSRCSRGQVVALDRSALQTKKARALNRSSIAAGRVRIETLALADAPLALGQRFSKVLAINVNAFWTEPSVSFASLRELLRPRGRALLVYETPSVRSLDKVSRAIQRPLTTSGFELYELHVARTASPPLLGVVAAATR
jgi:predicted nuclease with RNAse H fold